MKKIICIFCIVVQLTILFPQTILVLGKGLEVYNLQGKSQTLDLFFTFYQILDKSGNEVQLINSGLTDDEIDISENIRNIAKSGDFFTIINLMSADPYNSYPEIEKTSIHVSTPEATGNKTLCIGKDYRLFYFDNQTEQLTDISTQITRSDELDVNFEIDKLGAYILLFNPKVYEVTFYYEKPIFNDDGTLFNPESVYKKFENLFAEDIIEFPDVPERKGYVFTGWLVYRWRAGKDLYVHADPWPQQKRAAHSWGYIASWCKEEKYVPLEIAISLDETIRKGKENGKRIILKTNYGCFDQRDGAVFRCEVVGNDEIYVDKVNYLDPQSLEIILGGNSSDIYTNSEIYIEFDSSYIIPEEYYDEFIRHDKFTYYEDVKIKTDEKGVRAIRYRSDNSITLTKQKKKRPSGGGVSLPSMYTVTFNTSGGSEIKTQTLSSGSLVNLPDNPEKEGYVFGGWFTDKELTQEYNFEDKLTKNLILYAKWEEEDKTSEQIIFTVGSKTAMVFGKEKKNDVAPVIRSDRAFLPARFVAEALGAEVLWNEKTKTVTITKGDTKIVITVGADSAMINGKSTSLDASAFIENDRTYIPIRLIAEALAAKVEWHPEGQNITVIK